MVVIGGKALGIGSWFLALLEITATFMLAALGIRCIQITRPETERLPIIVAYYVAKRKDEAGTL